jgi:SAM-dependent methyltransferase
MADMRIYEGLSRYYDLGWGDFARQYIEVVEGLLRRKRLPRARILDIACGTGTLALALAALGHEVLGIDASPEMIAAARSKSGAANPAFKVGEMDNFTAEGLFDVITCTFDSLNYITEPRLLERVFRRVSSKLTRSGFFVFDSNTERQYEAVSVGSREIRLGSEVLTQSWWYDPGLKLAETTFTFGDGTVERHVQRPYGLPEIRRCLRAAHLEIVNAWSSPDGMPIRPESIRAYCVAEKTG